MTNRVPGLLVTVGLLLGACGSPSPTPQAPPPRIVTQPYYEPDLVAWALAYREAIASTLPFDVESMTSAIALQAVEDGEAEVVILSGTPPEDWFATPVGRVALAVIVNPDNPVRDLQIEELRSLFAGRTESWTEVGGRDLAVQPVLPLPGEPAGETFVATVIEPSRPWPGSLYAPSISAMLELVSEDKGAIGILPVSAVTEGVRPIRVDGLLPDGASLASGDYPLAIELIATAPQEPGSPVRDFIVWMQSQLPRPTG
ncbi:MAG TPA: substrate-binding domain-containing protein [Anaerolineales bacterium]|nr:substrate-binding domain-containing protein [Anaerolineales bacterium]